MGQLVLAAAGAAATTMMGIGPEVGWAVSSALGSAVFQPREEKAPFKERAAHEHSELHPDA